VVLVDPEKAFYGISLIFGARACRAHRSKGCGQVRSDWFRHAVGFGMDFWKQTSAHRSFGAKACTSSPLYKTSRPESAGDSLRLTRCEARRACVHLQQTGLAQPIICHLNIISVESPSLGSRLSIRPISPRGLPYAKVGCACCEEPVRPRRISTVPAKNSDCQVRASGLHG
jgi:hypothetical protein